MRLIVRGLVAVTSFLTALTIIDSPSYAAGGTATDDAAFVHRVVFDTSMSDFTAIVAGHVGPGGTAGDTWFEWDNDACSAPLVGNTGRSFNFTDACRRHDFAYRNTRLLDQRYGAGVYWNGDARKSIDNQFLSDMKRSCKNRRLVDRPTCYSWAYTFYGAVRIAGGP